MASVNQPSARERNPYVTPGQGRGGESTASDKGERQEAATFGKNYEYDEFGEDLFVDVDLEVRRAMAKVPESRCHSSSREEYKKHVCLQQIQIYCRQHAQYRSDNLKPYYIKATFLKPIEVGSGEQVRGSSSSWFHFSQILSISLFGV